MFTQASFVSGQQVADNPSSLAGTGRTEVATPVVQGSSGQKPHLTPQCLLLGKHFCMALFHFTHTRGHPQCWQSWAIVRGPGSQNTCRTRPAPSAGLWVTLQSPSSRPDLSRPGGQRGRPGPDCTVQGLHARHQAVHLRTPDQMTKTAPGRGAGQKG